LFRFLFLKLLFKECAPAESNGVLEEMKSEVGASA
jgi:hypothetical protein